MNYSTLKSKEEEAAAILSQLTLKEKVALCSGKDLWHLKGIRSEVPPVLVTDGPHGLIKRVSLDLLQGRAAATCFPTASALASGWDVELIERVGQALGRECFVSDTMVLLGPGMNIKRHPSCGRNFEYFSEDPYLTGKAGAAFVKGVQSQNVGSCIKHVCVNNQENDRFRINVVVDERTLREIYLKGFEMAIKEAQPWAVMTAYNKLNGQYCSEHDQLWSSIREDFGFEGLVMTDWGAADDRVKGIRSGVDLEMPGSFGANDDQVLKAIEKKGTLSEEDVDAVVKRNICLSLLGKEGLERKKQKDEESLAPVQVDFEAHHGLAKIVAMQCAVLLRNEDNMLPLKKDTSVAVIGEFAKHPRYQGMGSSQVLPTRLDTAWDHFDQHTRTKFYAKGYHHDDDGTQINKGLIQKSVEAAGKAHVAVIFCGLPGICESEGFDRENMDMPAQHCELIKAVSAANPRTVVVLSNGPPLSIASWVDAPKAILEGYLGGQASGSAMVDLIFGVESPCGKLAETFPMCLADVAANNWYPGENQQVQYREGLNVGYRYFDTANVPVLFPFGHGLSYATFEYSNLRLETDGTNVQVDMEVRNTGDMAAAEVVQCYVHACENEVYRPDQELKAFTKVFLHPGQEKTVTFHLGNDAFHFYDTGVEEWVVEKGKYEIRIASSSRDVRLRDSVNISKGKAPSPQARSSHPPMETLSVPLIVSDDAFAHMMDGNLPPAEPVVKVFHRNSVIGELKRSLLGCCMEYFIQKEALKHMESEKGNKATRKMAVSMLHQTPLRSLVLFSQGKLTYLGLDMVLALLNHRYIRFCKLVWRRNKPQNDGTDS